jgi:spore germination protein GerM
MTRIIITGLAVLILAICIISGGCSSLQENSSIKAWKELINISPEKKESPENTNETGGLQVKPDEFKESISIDLYFAGADGKNLVVEKRTIEKTEGIARTTLKELIKGPSTSEYINVLPEGTEILDINIKPDGLCILDMSSEIRNVSSAHQEELIVYAITNTLGQFPTVSNVSFMIDGQKALSIGGFIDISQPVEPLHQ